MAIIRRCKIQIKYTCFVKKCGLIYVRVKQMDDLY